MVSPEGAPEESRLLAGTSCPHRTCARRPLIVYCARLSRGQLKLWLGVGIEDETVELLELEPDAIGEKEDRVEPVEVVVEMDVEDVTEPVSDEAEVDEGGLAIITCAPW